MGLRKGQTNNPNGRPRKGQTLTDLMEKYLNKKVDTKQGKKKYKEIFVQKVIELAFKGELSAIKLIWNYIDGLPVQKIDQKTEISTKSPMAEAIQNLINENKQKTD